MPQSPVYVLGMSPAAIMTADELLRIPDKHAELVRGVLVVGEPPGLRHGRIAIELGAALATYARAHGLGRVYVESGFKLMSNPDTVRGPDVAFISQARLPDPEPVGYPTLAPDLVVGYTKGTRSSDESALGAMPADVFMDNTSPWSGDHCMDHEAVPGILLSSRPLKRPAPTLQHLARALLAEYGIDSFPQHTEVQSEK